MNKFYGVLKKKKGEMMTEHHVNWHEPNTRAVHANQRFFLVFMKFTIVEIAKNKIKLCNHNKYLNFCFIVC